MAQINQLMCSVIMLGIIDTSCLAQADCTWGGTYYGGCTARCTVSTVTTTDGLVCTNFVLRVLLWCYLSC